MRNSAWTNLSGEHEPLKNGHPCKTLTSVSTMSVSTMSVFTMLMSTMSNGHCPCPPWVGEVAWLRGEEKDGTEEEEGMGEVALLREGKKKEKEFSLQTDGRTDRNKRYSKT